MFSVTEEYSHYTCMLPWFSLTHHDTHIIYKMFTWSKVCVWCVSILCFFIEFRRWQIIVDVTKCGYWPLSYYVTLPVTNSMADHALVYCYCSIIALVMDACHFMVTACNLSPPLCYFYDGSISPSLSLFLSFSLSLFLSFSLSLFLSFSLSLFLSFSLSLSLSLSLLSLSLSFLLGSFHY